MQLFKIGRLPALLFVSLRELDIELICIGGSTRGVQ
jgi:hypothetical protein